MAINNRGRANVNYLMQTQLMRFYKDTAKVSSLPLLKITAKATHFLPAKKKTQKQPSRGVLRKRYFVNMQQIYRKTPMPKELAINLQRNFFEITLRHGCSPANLLHIFRTPLPRNTSVWLLLKILILWIELQTNKIQKVSKPYI